jgi:hypothetical protein
LEKPGINFTKDEDGKLVIGVHLQTFNSYFTPRSNKNGWINLKIHELEEMIGKYTHKFENVTKKSAA